MKVQKVQNKVCTHICKNKYVFQKFQFSGFSSFEIEDVATLGDLPMTFASDSIDVHPATLSASRVSPSTNPIFLQFSIFSKLARSSFFVFLKFDSRTSRKKRLLWRWTNWASTRSISPARGFSWGTYRTFQINRSSFTYVKDAFEFQQNEINISFDVFLKIREILANITVKFRIWEIAILTWIEFWIIWNFCSNWVIIVKNLQLFVKNLQKLSTILKLLYF